jgi:hypothetical protein
MQESAILIHPAAIRTLTEKSWNFSYQLLWRKYVLSDLEIDQVKIWIDNYYWSIEPSEFYERAEDYFNNFCKKTIETAGKMRYSEALAFLKEKITTSSIYEI